MNDDLIKRIEQLEKDLSRVLEAMPKIDQSMLGMTETYNANFKQYDKVINELLNRVATMEQYGVLPLLKTKKN